MQADLAELELQVQRYLDGLHCADVELLAQVYHPTSRLTYEENGKLVSISRDEWFQMLRGRPSANERGLEREEHLLQMDLASDGMALVKLKCAIPPRFFTDLLCFVKCDGRWVVAQKVFSIEIRP